MKSGYRGITETRIAKTRLLSLRQRRRACRRHVSFRWDGGDADSQHASSTFAPVTKVPCGLRETTISCDQWLVVVTVVVSCPLRIWVIRRYLSLFICDTWSVTVALPITKDQLCTLPKWVFHVVRRGDFVSKYMKTLRKFVRNPIKLNIKDLNKTYSSY
jgi:hypothetical protein